MSSVAGDLDIREGFNAIDFDQVHDWLRETYWSPGVSREKVERAARNSSLVISAYLDGSQIGYMRVVSDKATFAWLCDVYVSESARGKGVARSMVTYALNHPEHRGLRRWLLATADAQGVYAGVGFKPLDNPERWMFLRPVPPENWES
jgi:GNAT superfamily N-acetyltransferase